MPKTILTIGLTSGIDDEGKIWGAEEVRGIIGKQIQQCVQAGYYLTPHVFDADADPVAVLAKAKDLLRAKEGGFDAVAFGYGLRGSGSLNDLFEDLVNVVYTDGVVNGKAPRIVFILKPTDVYERLQRTFGKP